MATSVLRTKLHVGIDSETSLPRPRLLDLLHGPIDVPLTIIAAPAGYGKTVLAAQYAESLKPRAAWLSVDSSDNALAPFVRHLLAAIEAGTPVELPRSRRLTDSGESVTGQVLATTLLNELEDSGQALTVVLDDYHAVDDDDVHDFVAALVAHPAMGLHVVVVTRHDPPLRQSRLWGQGRVREIRAGDLRASRAELEELASRALSLPLSPDELDTLETETEGWIAGFCLALQARRHQPHATWRLRGASALDPTHVYDVLMAEVLASQPAHVQRCLLAASVPDRFTAALCDALLREEGEGGESFVGGREFFDALVAADLFVVSLGEDGTWFRFHHLFASLLRRQLRRRHGAEYEAELHRRASLWFGQEGSTDEAYQHALSSGDAELAMSVVNQFGYQLLDSERFETLLGWIEGLPPELRTTSPQVLALEALLRGEGLSQVALSSELMERAEALLVHSALNPSEYGKVRGSLDASSALRAFTAGDPERAVSLATRASKVLPTSTPRTLALAEIVKIGALQSSGDLAAAVAATEEAAEDPRFAGAVFRPWVWARPYIDWYELDMAAMRAHALVLLTDGERGDLPDTSAHGHYFIGLADYEARRIDEAMTHFASVVDAAFLVRPEVVVYSAIGLALCHLARGDTDTAEHVARAAGTHAWETSSGALICATEAFLAEVALRSGRPRAAMKWAARNDMSVPTRNVLYYDPVVTWVKTMLGSPHPDDRDRCRDVLETHIDFAERVHSTSMLVELLLLRALDRSSEGLDEAADADVLRAVQLTEPGGCVGLIADIGPALTPLLTRVNGDACTLGHVRETLNRLGTQTAAVASAAPESMMTASAEGAGPAALTPRELEILALLAMRWSNKEIGKELFISSATVKKHTVRLYEKFHVHSRRDVVDKAGALGYLP